MAATLRLHLEGQEGEIAFDSFVLAMNRCLNIIRDVDRVVSARRSEALRWNVAELHSRSGLHATIRAQPKQLDFGDLAQKVAAGSVEALRIAEGGEYLPPYLSDTGLNTLELLAAGLGKNGATGLDIEHLEQQSHAHVSKDVAQHVKRLRVPAVRAIGSVTGRLEAISLHRSPRFSVYDAVTKRAVNCAFAATALEAVKEALGRRVNVSGIVVRNSKGQPLRVERANLSVLPLDTDLPSTDDFVGHDPHFTGNLGTGEYLRQLHDA